MDPVLRTQVAVKHMVSHRLLLHLHPSLPRLHQKIRQRALAAPWGQMPCSPGAPAPPLCFLSLQTHLGPSSLTSVVCQFLYLFPQFFWGSDRWFFLFFFSISVVKVHLLKDAHIAEVLLLKDECQLC